MKTFDQISKEQLEAACAKFRGKGCVNKIATELDVTVDVLARLRRVYEVQVDKGVPPTVAEVNKAYTKRFIDKTGCSPCSLRHKTNPRVRLIAQAKRRALEADLEFDLHPSDIDIPATCPVLDIPLTVNSGSTLPSCNSPSIDRVDNSRGYTWDNVVVVSWRANRIKVDAEVHELEKVASFYRDHCPPVDRNPIVRAKTRTDKKLTLEQEQEIIRRFRPKGKGNVANVMLLAEEFGISRSLVYRIAMNKPRTTYTKKPPQG